MLIRVYLDVRLLIVGPYPMRSLLLLIAKGQKSIHYYSPVIFHEYQLNHLYIYQSKKILLKSIKYIYRVCVRFIEMAICAS